jgi:hypothetical protein
MLIPFVQAQVPITYTVNQEWVQLWINTDGSIDIKYNITLTYLSGSPQGIVTVGLPKGGFQIQYVRDLTNNSLQYRDVSNSTFYGIDVYLTGPIILGKLNTFLVYAAVPGMISQDKMNPGNVGMLFYPSTFPGAINTSDLRVAITLPQGVNSTEVRYPTGTPFTSVTQEGNYLVVYWNKTDWIPTQTFTAGVSFPEKYVSLTSGPDILHILLYAAAFIIAMVFVIGIIVRSRKSMYEKPRISVEALGSIRSLTAVEAGVLLDLKPVRILTMILFGLLIKRAVMVTTTDPLIKLKKLEKSANESSPPLRYYEIDYLKAIEPEGSLNEAVLARTYLELVENVNQKLRGYSRQDSVNYYKSIVNQAWTQVAQAGTPQLKGNALDKNIEWLLADDKFDERFKSALPPNITILPPGWWWYWWGPRFPSSPTTGQSQVPPTIPIEARPIPGQDFANNVVRSLETASNNMVKNVQDFTNRLVPAQAAAASERSVKGQSSCVCACHACACACACVGCACACAGGGAR